MLLPTFLPGLLLLSRGVPRDYGELARFHYLPRRPATWADVWTIRYEATDEPSRVVGIGVLSWPAPCCSGRNRALGLKGMTYGDRLGFANANLRTISRVIVHPQFRSLGLASVLIRCLCDHCPTRYVEAIAKMARAHPMFEKAGMQRFEPADADAPVYFLMDRAEDGSTIGGVVP